MCIYVSLSIYIELYAHAYIHTIVSIYLYIYTYRYIYIYLCIYTYPEVNLLEAVFSKPRPEGPTDVGRRPRCSDDLGSFLWLRRPAYRWPQETTETYHGLPKKICRFLIQTPT